MEKKHCYTPAEKREFFKIIKKYGPIIETKSYDGNTLRRKNIAWNRITCEYNTSSIAPYPASSKQLRRLWLNIKQRDKQAVKKFLQESPTTDAELPTEDTLENTDVEEEISTPYFVNMEGSENQDDSLKSPNTRGNTQEHDNLTPIDSEGRSFNLEFIDEMEGDVKPTIPHPSTEKYVQRLKTNLLVREYQDQKRRLNELHLLQKRLLLEQIRESRAKANLAELELKQQHLLES